MEMYDGKRLLRLTINGEEDGVNIISLVEFPAVINDTNPLNYTRNFTTAEEKDEINNQNIWVSVEEISNAENKRKVKVAESRF